MTEEARPPSALRKSQGNPSSAGTQRRRSVKFEDDETSVNSETNFGEITSNGDYTFNQENKDTGDDKDEERNTLKTKVTNDSQFQEGDVRTNSVTSLPSLRSENSPSFDVREVEDAEGRDNSSKQSRGNKKTVVFLDEIINTPTNTSKESSSLSEPKMSRMREELRKLDLEDERKKALEKEIKKRLIEEEYQREIDKRVAKGLEIMPDSRRSKGMVKKVMVNEETMATEKVMSTLNKENKTLKKQIHDKYKMDVESLRSTDLMDLTKTYFDPKKLQNDHLSENVLRDLTSAEIDDLKIVFDMFDANGKGYITSYDVQQAAGMLGFRAKRSVFDGMIDALTKDGAGRVTFTVFLEFVIQSQGEGPDPYEEILQGFRMIDKDGNGYITRDDITDAAKENDFRLSNKILKEMIEEADQTGDGKITQREFIDIMQQTSLFKTYS